MISPMKYVLVFLPNTCTYACHADGCKAASHNPRGNGAAYRMRIDEAFSTVDAAHKWADEDEFSKRDDAVTKPDGLAKFRLCACAKVKS